LLPIAKLLCIGSIIFWEIHINERSKCMPICSKSYSTVFVCMSVNNLFLKSTSLISITSIARLLSIDSISSKYTISFFGIKLLNSGFLFTFYLFLIIFLQGSDFFIMFLFELMVFFHYRVHSLVINIHINNFFSFFQSLIFIFKPKFFTQFFF